MDFYAHTSTLLDGKTTNSDTSSWEPLFTPFGKIDANEPSKACSGFNGEHDSTHLECPHCKNMASNHGHLNKVAFWTAEFARNMLPQDHEDRETVARWGYLTGLWHDLGKFSVEFQEYLAKATDPHQSEISQKVDHTTAGAKLAVSKHPVLGHFIANAIAGHHAGLLDARNMNSPLGASIENRLKKQHGEDLAGIYPPTQIINLALPSLPKFLKQADFAISSFQRFLFSCLVDADFLCTEAFMNPKQADQRASRRTDYPKALKLLEKKVSSFPPSKDKVNKARRTVYCDCVTASQISSPFFSLTVPTGGGKTLSSMAFALNHAIQHQKQKIIYVIPFTSIIEQNAMVFQEMFAKLGDAYVLEHHSNLSPEKETLEMRLSCENWEAPIIVTTAVQFYESLFAHSTSQNRKIHNITNSVIIFDEAQNIPIKYLNPCLEILKTLSSDYSVTSVLCTATQPAIQKSPHLQFGLENVQEIVQDVPTLFKDLERTKLEYRGLLKDDELIEELKEHNQVLVIVNTKKHAQDLAENITSDGSYHLSTSMCPKHRKEILVEVRQRLLDDLPTLLISTQLIEAGVDVDFPVVYRSLAGLDSMSQAAGRCNRNGKRPLSTVHIFESGRDNEAYFSTVKGIGYEILDLYLENPLEPTAIQNYFDKYYLTLKDAWDQELIMDDFRLQPSTPELPLLFQYKSASQKFKLIKEETVSVFIPYNDEAKKLLEELRHPTIPLHRKLFRKLQSYSVSIRKNVFTKYVSEFEALRDGEFFALTCPERHYNDKFGLNIKPLTISDHIL